MGGDQQAKQFALQLCSYATLSLGLGSSPGKFRTWALLIYAVCRHAPFARLVDDMRLLSLTVDLFSTHDGFILFTRRENLARAHICASASVSSTEKLVLDFCLSLRVSHAIDLHPLLTHVPQCHVIAASMDRRLLLLGPSDLETLRIEDGGTRLLFGAHETPVRVAEDGERAGLPHFLKGAEEGESWMRVEGTTYAFANRIAVTADEDGGLWDATVLPCCHVDASPEDPSVLAHILRFFGPDEYASPAVGIPLIARKDLDLNLRRYMFGVLFVRHGVTDVCLSTLLDAFSIEEADADPNASLALAYRVACLAGAEFPRDDAKAASVLSEVADQEWSGWVLWVRTSSLLVWVLLSLSWPRLVALLDRSGDMRRSLCEGMAKRVWTPQTAEVALLLRASGMGDERVDARLVEMEEKAERAGRDVCNPPAPAGTAAAKRGGGRRRRAARWEKRAGGPLPPAPPSVVAAGEGVEAEEAADDPLPPLAPDRGRDHVALFDRVAAKVGLPCTLIGSGLFSDASDLDVVVLAPPDVSLRAAHDLIAARTGWAPVGQPTGERTVPLVGEEEGVRVEAQVWRGKPLTPSEERTERALRLTRRLAAEADGASERRSIRALHAWASASGAKGSGRCMLPGIVCTIAALVLGRSGPPPEREADVDAWLRTALRDLADLLGTPDGVPVLSLDGCSRGGAALPCSPLVVLDGGSPLPTRMTVKTTRALAFLAEAGARSPPGRLLDGFYYREEVVRGCALCAVVRSKCVSASLQKVAADLEGYPLLSSVLFRQEGEVVKVYGRMEGGADARYCLTKDHILSEAGNGSVLVELGEKRWTLRPCEGGEAASLPSTVADRVRVGSSLVFNAPTLCVDVEAKFDRRHWETL